MTLMRILIWIGFPIGLLFMAASVTMLLGWTNGDDLCRTWMSPALTYCR